VKNKHYLWIVCCIFLCISGCNNAEKNWTYNSLVVGDEYAAYVDETGRLSIFTIDVDGNVWTAYPYTADEVEEQLKDLYNNVAEYGLVIKQ